MKMYRTKKGETLLEAVITIAILGIIAAGFLGVFINGLNNVQKMGEKTKAVGEAKRVLNSVCENKDISTIPGEWARISDKVNLYVYESSKPKKYFVENYSMPGGYDYKKITVVIFYNKGTTYTQLTAIIPNLRG